MAKISLITYISCVISRLVYFHNTEFLEKYTDIFNLKDLSSQLKEIKEASKGNIFVPITKKIYGEIVGKRRNVLKY